MRSIVGWGVLPLALACSFDPTGVGTMAPATTADSDPGDAADTTGVDVGTSTTGVPMPVTVSVGAALQGENERFDALFKRADEALYEAKRAGRNRVVVAAGP